MIFSLHSETSLSQYHFVSLPLVRQYRYRFRCPTRYHLHRRLVKIVLMVNALKDRIVSI